LSRKYFTRKTLIHTADRGNKRKREKEWKRERFTEEEGYIEKLRQRTK
jgi:hypothetical protein